MTSSKNVTLLEKQVIQNREQDMHTISLQEHIDSYSGLLNTVEHKCRRINVPIIRYTRRVKK